MDVFSARHLHSRTVDHLQASRTALLIIDMINDCCSDSGGMNLPGAENLFPNIDRLAEAVRGAGAIVIWVRDEHENNDPEFRIRQPHALTGSWGSQVAEGLNVCSDDQVRTKHTYSAFYGTDLDNWLRRRNIADVIVGGVVTNICVRSTVHDAFFHGYDVYVPRDCCAGTSEREHNSSLYDIDTHFGLVTDSESIISVLEISSSRR